MPKTIGLVYDQYGLACKNCDIFTFLLAILMFVLYLFVIVINLVLFMLHSLQRALIDVFG